MKVVSHLTYNVNAFGRGAAGEAPWPDQVESVVPTWLPVAEAGQRLDGKRSLPTLSAWELAVTPAKLWNTCPDANDPAGCLIPWPGGPEMMALLFPQSRWGQGGLRL